MAWAQVILVRSGGAGGRNSSPASITKGVIAPQFVNTGVGWFGGVSWYPPGDSVGSENGGGTADEPSLARAASMNAAARWPTRTPASVLAPVGTVANSSESF